MTKKNIHLSVLIKQGRKRIDEKKKEEIKLKSNNLHIKIY